MTPSNLITCLSGIVGLSPDIPGDSLSGYNLTDQKDGMPVRLVGASVDTQSGPGAILRAAREDGVRNFLTDFSAEFSGTYRAAYAEHSGYIGKIEASTAITNARSRAVFQIKSRGVDGVLSIRGFQMYQSVTGNVTVNVYDAEDITTPLGTKVVAAVANRWTSVSFDTPILINLADVNRSDNNLSRYFITWEIPENSYPRYNKAHCCTPVSPAWMNFVEVGGYSVNSLSEMTNDPVTALSHGSFGMGIALDCSIACSFGTFMCGMDYNLNKFAAGGFQWVLAKTLQHAGVMNLADVFIKSQNINQYTILSREAVYGIRSHAEKEYLKGVKYLVQNMPEGALGCFECRETRYRVESILF